LLPIIEIKEDILDDDAKELVKLCPTNVYDLEDIGNHQKAYVKNPRNCTTCRECIRPPQFKDRIDLGKIKDHYECNLILYIIY
jgi:DNA-directed RNA polymerase I and III subunit RPAC1